MFHVINYLIYSPSFISHRLFLLFFIQRIIITKSSSSSLLPQQKQQFSLFTRHDIVDKNVKAVETFLSAQDLTNMPEREVDLRELGIRVETDPTLGTRNRGDIAELPPSLRPQFDSNGIARNSIRQPYRRWPRNEIPYALSSQYGSYSRSVIAKAMDEYHSKTCVRFVPRDLRRHRDYVYIHPDDGCYSLVGRTGGKQPLSLDSGCIQVGTVVHELMHAVGFFHEQSRHDRDQYIQILWPNVLRGADDQFEKYSFNAIDQLGEPYDYGSIMHYGAYAFSANGKRTIVPRRQGYHKMGQRIAFSETDLRKINKLYQCDIFHPRNSLNSLTNNRPFAQQEMPSIVNGGEEQDNDCEDKNWRCIFWSLPAFKYCLKWEALRKEICPFSCGQCPKPKTEEDIRAINNEEIDECRDESSVCTKLSREHCPGLTGKLCKKTCGLCEQ